MDKLEVHHFVFNPSDNGGEQLILTTEWHANGDPITETEGVLATQQLTLHSYGNSATFNLVGALLTPAKLRKLASELEQMEKQVRGL